MEYLFAVRNAMVHLANIFAHLKIFEVAFYIVSLNGQFIPILTLSQISSIVSGQTFYTSSFVKIQLVFQKAEHISL